MRVRGGGLRGLVLKWAGGVMSGWLLVVLGAVLRGARLLQLSPASYAPLHHLTPLSHTHLPHP